MREGKPSVFLNCMITFVKKNTVKSNTYSHFNLHPPCFGCFQAVFIRACGFSNCWCNLDLMGSFCLMSSQSTQVRNHFFFQLNSVTLLCRKMMIEAPRYFLSMIFLRMTGLFVFLHHQHKLKT